MKADSEQGTDRICNESGCLSLKQIFYQYADDMIDVEQVRRILEPILKAINNGEFDEPVISSI